MNRVVRRAVVLSVLFFSAFGASAAHAAGVATWCGGANMAQADRKPDLLVGNQIDVIYAHPADAPDHFAQLASPIATDIAAVDAWWRKQDPTRTPRFDLFAFPGCASTYGDLDLADMALPQASAFYFNLDARFDRILNTLDGPPFNVNDTSRKYIIYYDGPISDLNTCGQGGGYSNLYSSGPSWAVIYMQACGLNVGDANHAAHVVTHELIHSLGAVGPGAPHDCPAPNDGHVCDSPIDILYPFLSDTSVFDTEVLDVNRDDYYGNGGQFDIRNSSWLQHLDVSSFALTVATAGSGTGTVTSDVGSINCPGTCSSTQVQGTKLTLTAAAASGSRFAGWSGACTGTGVCVVSFDAATTVTATFSAQTSLTVNVDASRASGTVVSEPANISCPGKCTASFDKDQVVQLTAHPGTGSRLEAWGGACSGRGDCSVTLSQAMNVTATFGPASHQLAASVKGKGKVVSAPRGIACPGRCSFAFDIDSVVSLKAVPAKGYKFAGWSGACRGKAGCSVTMSADATVRATFKKK